MELLYVFNAFPFAGEVTFQITFLYYYYYYFFYQFLLSNQHWYCSYVFALKPFAAVPVSMCHFQHHEKIIITDVVNFDVPVVQQHPFYGPMHRSWWLYSLQEMETIVYF